MSLFAIILYFLTILAHLKYFLLIITTLVSLVDIDSVFDLILYFFFINLLSVCDRNTESPINNVAVIYLLFLSCKHFVVLILVLIKLYFCLRGTLLGKAHNLIVVLDLLQ
jgi:hypothetical protein